MRAESAPIPEAPQIDNNTVSFEIDVVQDIDEAFSRNAFKESVIASLSLLSRSSSSALYCYAVIAPWLFEAICLSN